MRGRWQGKPDAGGSLKPRSWAAVLAALILPLMVPLSAQAATSAGQTPPPAQQEGASPSMLPTLCPGGVHLAQAKTAAAPFYAVPSNGVITSWTHRGATVGAAGSGRLMVWRAVSADRYTLVGKSSVESFTPNEVTSFSTRIAVKTGDLLGLGTAEDGVACFFSNLNQTSMQDQIRFHSGQAGPPEGGGGGGQAPATGNRCVDSGFNQRICQDDFCEATFEQGGYGSQCKSFPSARSASATDPADGETVEFAPIPADGARVNVAAGLEPDADADGYGDETQDLCPADATTSGACPQPGGDNGEVPGPPPTLLSLSGKAVQPLRGAVRVLAACPSVACDLTATGRLIVKPPAREGLRGPRRIRGFKLGRASASLGAGESKALSLRIRKPARKAAEKAISQGGSVRALVRVRAVDESGNDSYDRTGIKLRSR